MEKDIGGKAAYQSFKHVIKPEEVKRQAMKEGDFQQQRFVDILSEMQEGFIGRLEIPTEKNSRIHP